jgi:hypothetical protein
MATKLIFELGIRLTQMRRKYANGPTTVLAGVFLY